MDTDWLSRSWTWLLLRGAVALVFGILAMLWPLDTTIALVILWGVWALADGAASLVQAVRTPQGWAARAGFVLMGVVAVAAAFFAFTKPGVTVVALTWVLGVWLLARGVIELFGAFSSSVVTGRWVLVLGAVVDGALGLIFVTNPGRSVLGVAFLIGLLAFVWGVVFVALAFSIRRLDKEGSTLPPGVAPA